jgi:DNA-binding beta-propeller fold protein YncE
MLRSLAVAASLAAVSLSASFAAAATPPLLGVQFRSSGTASSSQARLYDVDIVTGAATNMRISNASALVGIRYSPDGVLYGLTDQFSRLNNVSGSSGKNILITLDPATARGTLVGQLAEGTDSPFWIGEGDLDFDPLTGQLYVVASQNGSGLLFKVDRTNGAPTMVGTMFTGGDASAMAFDPAGNLWVLDTTVPSTTTGPAKLRRIDKSTGAVLELVQTDRSIGVAAGMAFDPDSGRLYVADGDFAGRNELMTLDPATGQFSTIGLHGAGAGTTWPGLAGLAFVIPEPASLSLLFLGGGLLLRRRGH